MTDRNDTIGEYIQKLAEEQNLNPTDFGRRIHTSIQNAKDIYKRSTIDSDLILTISRGLNKNIFDYFNNIEPIASFRQEEVKEWEEKINKLKDHIGSIKDKNTKKDSRIRELLARISDQERIITLLQEKEQFLNKK